MAFRDVAVAAARADAPGALEHRLRELAQLFLRAAEAASLRGGPRSGPGGRRGELYGGLQGDSGNLGGNIRGNLGGNRAMPRYDTARCRMKSSARRNESRKDTSCKRPAPARGGWRSPSSPSCR